MSAKIFYTTGSETCVLPCAALLTIGRTPPNDLVLPHPGVSRNHAMIRMLGHDEYYLIDVGSTNGTFLNNKRVVTPVLLKDNDRIVIEDQTLTFAIEEERLPEPVSDEEGEITLTLTSMGVKTETLALLVCDIRGYTRISEIMPPNALSALMGAWFKAATPAIEECGGTIDKFLGDAILARWAVDSPEGAGMAVTHALRAAGRLQEVCAHINASFPSLPDPFRVGVGINAGQAVMGNIGGGGYREYTAIGDAVNMAFRFESETKALGRDVVIGPDAYAHLPPHLWQPALREVTVKGKGDPVRVWAITFEELSRIPGCAHPR
ncbi:MAG: adenylate/guanylate cyclase domain-containing protein [Kiritimatiellia bacterium]|jgi:adenylate cyclase|nr:adenylate/guanylate cyclase domain-containing protein [Kiritimatiellia bacterium]